MSSLKKKKNSHSQFHNFTIHNFLFLFLCKNIFSQNSGSEVNVKGWKHVRVWVNRGAPFANSATLLSHFAPSNASLSIFFFFFSSSTFPFSVFSRERNCPVVDQRGETLDHIPIHYRIRIMFRRLAIQLRTLAPPRSASKAAVGASRHSSETVIRSLPVYSRHFSTESGLLPNPNFWLS